MLPRRLHLDPAAVESLFRLRKQAERDGAHRVIKRIKAVILNAWGLSSGELTSGALASILKAPRSKVSKWLLRYEQRGLEGLLDGQSGRPPRMTAQQRIRLGSLLRRGPAACGYDNGVWTSDMVAQVIAERFRVRYHPGHVRRLLKNLGLPLQRPRRARAPAVSEGA